MCEPAPGCNGQGLPPLTKAVPVHGRILVKRLPAKSTSRGGVVLPASYEGKWQYEPSSENCAAEVIALPEQVFLKRRKGDDPRALPKLIAVEPECKVGDHVLLHRYAASPDADGYSYVEYRHILGVLDRKTAELVESCIPLGGAEAVER